MKGKLNVHKFLFIGSVFALCVFVVSCKTAKQATAYKEETYVVFEPDTFYASMRIPALVLTTKGTLVAFCEARIGSSSDWASMNLAMRRSSDGGKTWSEIQIIAQSNSNQPVGNPCPIVDRNGKVHLLFQRNYSEAFYTWSEDDGLTWQTPRNITSVFDQFKPEYAWNVVATGPGHGIQLQNGRLLAAAWMARSARTSPRRRHAPSCVATVYSDDGGQTWQRGAIVADSSAAISNPNESMPVQLADGRVLLSIRNTTRIKQRAFSYSNDGSSNWSAVRFEEELFDPTCMASIIAVPATNKNDRPGILFVNPDSRDIEKHPRQNLTAKISYDNGYTWPVQKVLNSGASGYSDMAAAPDGTIYCLYETNTVSKGWDYSLLLKKIHINQIRKK